jgi:hypothetical protein
MTARTEAARGLVYWTAGCFDRSVREADKAKAAYNRALFDLMTPVVKSWATDGGVQVASEGVQLHGGMGFIEETGAAQHYRDARILPIYEGTNGVQAIDLVGRKISKDGGVVARELFKLIGADISHARETGDTAQADAVATGLEHLTVATDWVVATMAENPDRVLAQATTFQKLFGTVTGAWQMLRQASGAKARLDSGSGDATWLEAKRTSADFYMRQELPLAGAMAAIVTGG